MDNNHIDQSIKFCPDYTLGKLQNAKSRYIIRPAEPRDHDAIRHIFSQGMLEYDEAGSNIRTLFPWIDEQHKDAMLRGEKRWAGGFKRYVDYELKQLTLSDISNYWSMTRRGVMLVAEEISCDGTKGKVVGTAAILAGDLLDGDLWQDNFSYWMNKIKKDINPKQQQEKYTYFDFIRFCQFSVGNLPAEYYVLDDPMYDNKTYNSQQYCCILPTPTLPSSTTITQSVETNNNNPQFIPNPPSNDTIKQCQCQHNNTNNNNKTNNNKCQSKRNALKYSKLDESERVSSFCDLTQDDIEKEFCYCVRNAMNECGKLNAHSINNQDNNNKNNNKINICSFCIDDAKYLIQPILINNNNNNDDINKKYIINQEIFKYSNMLSSNINLKHDYEQFQQQKEQQEQQDQDNNEETNFYYTKKCQFGTHSDVPHGYYRRFKCVWDGNSNNNNNNNNINAKLGNTTTNNNNNNNDNNNNNNNNNDFIPHELFSSINANGEHCVATIPIDAYDKFISVKKQEQQQQKDTNNNINPENNDNNDNTLDNYNWGTHYNIPKDQYPTSDPLLTTQNLFTCAEIKRVSVARDHRDSGVAALLLQTLCYFARFVLKYDFLHLTTAGNMNLAVAFYRRMGFTEEFPDFEAHNGGFPIAHFVYPLTKHGDVNDPKLFEVSHIWPDAKMVRTELRYNETHAVIIDEEEEKNNKKETQ